MTLCRVPWLSVMGSLTPSVSSSGLENTSGAVTKVSLSLLCTAQTSPLSLSLNICAMGPFASDSPGLGSLPSPSPEAVLQTHVEIQLGVEVCTGL